MSEHHEVPDRPTERDIIADFLHDRYGADAPYRATDVLVGLLDSAGYGGWPTTDEVQELETLRAAIKAHHYDSAHIASKGLGIRSADRALYQATGFPDIGESDTETAAQFLERMEAIEAERDRLRSAVERFADHRPECAVGADYPCDCGLDAALQQLGQLYGSENIGGSETT